VSTVSQNIQGIEPAAAHSSESPAFVNPWRIALRHKWIMAMGVVLGLATGSLYFALKGPDYESTAELLVIKKHLDNSPISGEAAGQIQPEDYLATHQAVIVSSRIVGEAIEKNDLQNLDCFRDSNDLTNAIIRALSVTRGSRKAGGGYANVLTLSFRGKVPKDCTTIVNAIIAQYQDFLRDAYKNVNNDTLRFITRARDVLDNQIRMKQKEYDEFRQKTSIGAGSSIHQERLSDIDKKRWAARIRRAEIQAILTAIDRALGIAPGALESEAQAKLTSIDTSLVIAPGAQGARIPTTLTTIDGGPVHTSRVQGTDIQTTLTGIELAVKKGRGLADLVDILSGSPSVREPGNAGMSDRGSLDQELLKLQLEEASLSRYYERNHPEMQNLRKRIEVVRAAMAPSSATGIKSSERLAMDQDYVKRKIQLLKQEVDKSKTTEEGLDREFEREQEKARIGLEQETKDETYRQGIAQSQRLYDNILKRLEDINVIQDYGGYDTQVITPPERGKLVTTGILLIFATALFFGSLVGFVGAWLVDISDKSFRTPEEIRQGLTCPVLGYIPRFRPDGDPSRKAQSDGTRPAASLCTYYQSATPEAEAYRSVRTALFFNAHAQGYKVVQITSPKKGDGKTTLAANLAFSIAQSGKRILLVDADLRNPCVDKVFPVRSTVGLSSVLADGVDLASAIQPGLLPELSILPCGPLPSNPAELLTSPRLQELLDSLRQQYDFVLVDTPPLLTVTDPAVVAARVDGIILTIRLSLTGRSHAQQAREMLNSMRANLLGVVINGISNRSSSYGYGAASYGYGNQQ
jgi:capsular exopolysaccharide synthesis family protein